MISLVARGIASLAGRMITRNPRLGRKLISLYSGKGGRSFNVNAQIAKDAKEFGLSKDIIRKNIFKDQWWTTDKAQAMGYTNLFKPSSQLWKTKVTPKELASFGKYVDRVNKTRSPVSKMAQLYGKPRIRFPMPGGSNLGMAYGEGVKKGTTIIPRYKLRQLEIVKDYLVKEKLKNLWKGIGGILNV